MYINIIRISFALISVSVLIFGNTQARHVNPVRYGYGYAVQFPFHRDDLTISASGRRPVVVQTVNNPATNPAVVAPVSVDSDSLVSEASVKIEKILRKPMSFSYNRDQDHQASSQTSNSAQKVTAHVDQQPDAIDYYKYLARLEDEEKGGASRQKDTKKKSGYTSSTPVGFRKRGEKHTSKSADIALHHHESRPVAVKHEVNEDVDEGEHSEHGEDSHESSSKHEEKAEDHETSATEHKGGENKDYEKGGGKDHKTEFHDINDKKGEKIYDGKHRDDEENKGKHEKKGYDIHYSDIGGHKEADHDDDEYHDEHEEGEEGKQEADFHEEGEHSKGHSTSGEHNIHKKDEYEKKQEFYDESHEGGDQEKHGKYFHEDEFKKGGHESGSHEEGGDHKEHHGQEKHYEKGGHQHQDDGHKKSEGHAGHHEHHEKGGKKGEHDGHKEWSYEHGQEKGTGDKKGDSEGHGSKIQEVASSDKAADAEAHGSTHHDQAKGARYAVYGIPPKQQEDKEPGDSYGAAGEGTNRYMLVIVDDDTDTSNGKSAQESSQKQTKKN